MYTTLDAVIQFWDEQYKLIGYDFCKIDIPGYTNAQIEAHEQQLETTIHARYRDLLLMMKLDTIRFGNLKFSQKSLSGSQLQTIEHADNEECAIEPDLVGKLLVIGYVVGEGRLLLNNETGEVLFCRFLYLGDSPQPPLPKLLASSPEAVMCIATSLVAARLIDGREMDYAYLKDVLLAMGEADRYDTWKIILRQLM